MGVSRKRKVSRKKRVSRKRKVSRKKKVSRKRVVRRKARKRVSIRGTRRQVFRGVREKVKTTGQKKNELMKNKRGRIISKKAHANGKRAFKQNGLGKWQKAFMEARKNLGLTGFVACKKGSKFYKEAMRIYKN